MSDTCPYRGEDPFVYVSYAREDRNECILAIKHLDALGYRAFYEDVVDEDTLAAAASVIVLVSPCTCDSDEVREEIQLANKANKDVLAIHLSEVDLFGTVGLLLDAADDVKKFRMKEAFYRQRLEKGIDSDIKRDGVVPPPLPKEADKVMPAKSKKKTGAISATKKGAPQTDGTPKEGGPKAPGLMEVVENLSPKQQALYGGLAVVAILLVGAVFMFASGGTDDTGPVAGGGGTTAEDGPRDTYTEADRKKDAERRRKKQEKERKESKDRELSENAYATGVVLLDGGKTTEAIAKFSEAISLRSDKASFFAGRAKAYYANKQDIEAIKDYSKAIMLDPKNTTYYMARGHVRQFKDPPRAVADFGVVIEREPKNPKAWIARGDAYRRKGKKADLKAAFKDYTASIKLKKSYAAYYGRSLARKTLGDKKGALKDQDRARKAR